MNNDQTNRVTMYKTTIGVLDENNAIWNAMAPFTDAVTRFKNKVNAIDAAAQKQETPTGATQDKAGARDALEDVLFLMCEALGVLAHTGGDHDLLALTDITRSGIDKLDVEALSNRATLVLAQANARKTELTTLQVTQENIDELTQALLEYNEAKSGPRQATTARTVQTEALGTLIREANDILRNELDRMVNLFSRTNPHFVSNYQAARVIVDRAASHAAAKTASPTTAPSSFAAKVVSPVVREAD
jgi:hypothetical protein